jgi:hypothetical protein
MTSLWILHLQALKWQHIKRLQADGHKVAMAGMASMMRLRWRKQMWGSQWARAPM